MHDAPGEGITHYGCQVTSSEGQSVEHLAVILKVISDYDYITNVIDYDYDCITSESHDYDYDYDYLRSCNRLQPMMITDYDYPTPCLIKINMRFIMITIMIATIILFESSSGCFITQILYTYKL